MLKFHQIFNFELQIPNSIIFIIIFVFLLLLLFIARTDAGEAEGDLKFNEGDTITVTDQSDPGGWWQGKQFVCLAFVLFLLRFFLMLIFV